ncbi:protein unc-13 homolog D-like isoform X2 [Saccostrea echinata]|uniref:protein unc-13 homolog D-like isoform X2 n=1 Tax=Saccostrea echinata TaxID=191078 RepID=UPI002A839A7E|nr:protein unc-13 homolog D-like isoform X2 [Saccostrea echinata]
MRNSKYRSGMCMRTRLLSVPWKFTASKTDDEREWDSNLERIRGSRSADVRTELYRGADEDGVPFVSETPKATALKSVSLDSSSFLGVPSTEHDMKLRSQSDGDVIDGGSQTSSGRNKRRKIATLINRVRHTGRRSTVSCMNSQSMKCEDFKIHVPTTGRQHSEDVFYPQNPVNENVYCGILRCLLHPLGNPDVTTGLRPGDLIHRLKEVFEVNQEEQEFYIRQEMFHRPHSIQANICIIEAKGLHTDTLENCNPYCLVNIYHPLHRNSSFSPKTSPKPSPKSSPQLKKHSTTLPTEVEEMLKTNTAKHTVDPQWNEEFQLPMEDLLTDEIHLFICNQDQESGAEKPHHDKLHLLSSLLKNVLHVSDHDRLDQHLFGKVIIPVREIPAQGCDWWWDITSPSSKGSKLSWGKCHIKVHLSHQQSSVTGSQPFSVEDYYQAAEQFYKHAIKGLEVNAPLDPYLNKQDSRILDLFAQSYGISKLSQILIHIVVLLEWSSSHDDITTVDQALQVTLQELQMIWASKQFDISACSQKMPITDAEIMMYRRAAKNYISTLSDQLDNNIELFPPYLDNINTLRQKFGVCILLLELDLWDSKSSPHSPLTQKILRKLQDDTDHWTSEKVEQIYSHDTVQDPVIPRMNALVELTNLLSSHCLPMGVVNNLYNTLGIGYFRIVSFCVERKISLLIKELCHELDVYQRKYHQFSVNITYSSRLALRMFFAAKKFYSVVRDNVSRRDVFRLTIHQYQDWFLDALVFWLQTFRTECLNRIERALEIDKDVVVTHSLVKFSNSSVDVKACFAQITEEWRQIDYHDPDASVMGIIKITDLICDGARIYTDKIHVMMEKSNFYDDGDEQFDITERLCITLNNIEHVRQYLKELPVLLDWESVCMLLSTKHENDDIGNKSSSTLSRLITSAGQEILLKCSLLIAQIVEKMKVDMARFMGIFTQKTPEKASSIDQLFQYLSTNLRTLKERLFDSMYPHITEELWKTITELMEEQVFIGERPEYYSQMKQFLRALTSYFAKDGLEESKIQTEQYNSLKARLELSSLSTEELMLEYFNNLADDIVNEATSDFLGNLAVKVSYIEETRGNVTIFIKVIRASDLPGLDHSGLSDPYVVVSLYPKTMFGHNKPQKTKVVEQTLNPVFNTTFQFPNVPREYMSVRGAVLLLSILDHDKIGSDDFAGEVAIHLSSISPMEMSTTVDSKHAIMLPIKRPTRQTQGPYKVLVERSNWDKTAKLFITDRRRFIEKQRQRTDLNSRMSGFLSFFRGKKS